MASSSSSVQSAEDRSPFCSHGDLHETVTLGSKFLKRHASSSSEDATSCATFGWTKSVIDKLGIRYQCLPPTDIVTEHMSYAWGLLPQEKCDLDEQADIFGMNNLNHETMAKVSPNSFMFSSPDEEKLRNANRFKDILNVSTYIAFLKKFGISLWYMLKEKRAVSKPKYQCLFEQFLQMFGMNVIGQPSINKESTRIFNKEMFSTTDIICLSTKKRGKYCLAMCKVKSEQNSREVNSQPTASKLRRSNDMQDGQAEGEGKPPIPDDWLAQHVGELLVYLGKSICKEALLGMIVERTLVTFTRLVVTEETMKKLEFLEEGRLEVTEDERPVLYYSKPYNYLLEEDRKEIVKALLTLTILEHRTHVKYIPFLIPKANDT